MRQGKVAWVGEAVEVPSDCEIIDLDGKTVLPGLTDAHTHIFLEAMSRVQLRTAGARSIAELLELVRDAAVDTGDGEWLIASDYNELLLTEQRHVLRHELDRVASSLPVLLRRVGGHLAVANSAALTAAGINETVSDPFGGTFDREHGRLNGILRESAEWCVARVAPMPPAAEMCQSILEVSREYLSYGVVAAVDAATGFTCGFEAEWAIWEQARAEGCTPLRMGFMPNLSPQDAAACGLFPGRVDPYWQAIGLKWFVDGIIGARTAYLSQNYSDTPSRGTLMQPAEEIRSQISEAHALGWQVATHAIGDCAIDLVLDSLEAGQSSNARPDPRHRIEHLGLVGHDVGRRLQALGVVVVPQYGFLPRLGASFRRAIGETRMQLAYPGRSLIDHGITVAGSSDLPIGPMSPYVGISAAIQRSDGAGNVFSPKERMDPADAIAIYTGGGARAMRHEGFRGSLREGMAADLAVLSANIDQVRSNEADKIRSVLTFLDGKVVFHDGPFAPKSRVAKI
tara:strand:+ start:4826 stop:6361 length:1536 start_codon:yes stop_codon:yes gene_type:complete